MDKPIFDASTTCSCCVGYIGYEDDRGWCKIFNRQKKKTHPMTEDCQQNGAIVLVPVTEQELEESEYQAGNRIKEIDAETDHESWTQHLILEARKNPNLYRTSESYLKEALWYYLVLTSHKRQLWLAENQICLAQYSHLICTDEIF